MLANQFVSSRSLEMQSYVVRTCEDTLCGSTSLTDGDSHTRLVQKYSTYFCLNIEHCVVSGRLWKFNPVWSRVMQMAKTT